GRRATGDGRRATGDGRRATGDGRRATPVRAFRASPAQKLGTDEYDDCVPFAGDADYRGPARARRFVLIMSNITALCPLRAMPIIRLCRLSGSGAATPARGALRRL
ncbi:MAG: hypothetical protein ACYS7Y_35040, partial [Planctomycetota bacterium]